MRSLIQVIFALITCGSILFILVGLAADNLMMTGFASLAFIGSIAVSLLAAAADELGRIRWILERPEREAREREAEAARKQREARKRLRESPPPEVADIQRYPSSEDD